MISRIGVWQSQFALLPADEVRRGAAALEEMGYGALWFPEALGREAMASAALLLEATEAVTVASGIANIWVRDPVAAANGARALSEAHPDRFILGLGISHRRLVESRGHDYEGSLSRMADYLDALEQAPWIGPPVALPPVVLAALGPKMLRLAAEKTQGAHPYFCPVAHTSQARQIVGPDLLLAPEQMLVLTDDEEVARRIGRATARGYLRLPNYRRNLLRLGFRPEDLEGQGSDRLLDAIIAWGDIPVLVERVRQQLDAGADHVCVQVLLDDRDVFPLEELRAIAPALLALEEL